MQIRKAKTLLWIIAVLFLSFICYLPMLSERLSISALKNFVFLKYLFVLIPAVISLIFLISEHSFKEQCKAMFSKGISAAVFCVWILFIVIGLISSVFSTDMKFDVFRNTYSSLGQFVFSIFYLSMTGFVEEIAWRGFLLKRIFGKSIGSVLTVGVIWALWHIPMWAIRNSSSITDIVLLFIWTVLVSVVLGISFYKFENIFAVTVLHMIFNICYLAPIQYNIAVLTIVIAIGSLLLRKHSLKK